MLINSPHKIVGNSAYFKSNGGFGNLCSHCTSYYTNVSYYKLNVKANNDVLITMWPFVSHVIILLMAQVVLTGAHKPFRLHTWLPIVKLP